MKSIAFGIVILVIISGCASYERPSEPITINAEQLCASAADRPKEGDGPHYCDQFLTKTPSKELVQKNHGTTKLGPLKNITPRMQSEINRLKKRLDALWNTG
jgi:hypothetical protein